jgi:hypothetical protein
MDIDYRVRQAFERLEPDCTLAAICRLSERPLLGGAYARTRRARGRRGTGRRGRSAAARRPRLAVLPAGVACELRIGCTTRVCGVVAGKTDASASADVLQGRRHRDNSTSALDPAARDVALMNSGEASVPAAQQGSPGSRARSCRAPEWPRSCCRAIERLSIAAFFISILLGIHVSVGRHSVRRTQNSRQPEHARQREQLRRDTNADRGPATAAATTGCTYPAARAACQYRDMHPFKISKQGFLV